MPRVLRPSTPKNEVQLDLTHQCDNYTYSTFQADECFTYGDYSFPYQYNDHFNRTSSVLQVSMGTPIGFMIVCFNVVAIVALCRNKKAQKSFNWLTMNLALTDSMCGGMLAYHSLRCLSNYIDVLNDDDGIMRKRHLLHPIECRWRFSMITSSSGASLLSITAMTIDRALSLSKPLKHHHVVSAKGISCCLLLIWTVSLSAGFGLYFGNCFLAETCSAPLPVCEFYVVTSPPVCLVFISLWYCIAIVNVSIYLMIWRIAKRHVAHIMTPHMHDQAYLRQHTFFKFKSTRTVSIILAALLGCYGPVILFSTYHVYMSYNCPGCVDLQEMHMCVIADVSYVLMIFNSFLNPIIYGCRVRAVREQYVRILCCRKCCDKLFVDEASVYVAPRRVSYFEPRRHADDKL